MKGTPLIDGPFGKWPIFYLILGPLWAIGIAGWVLLPMARFQAEMVKVCTSESQGTVTGYESYNHASGIIQYSVNGITYTTSKFGMKSSDVGTKGVVYYDPQNPARGYFGNYNFSWTGWLIGIVSFVVGVTIVMLLAYFDARRKMNRRLTAN